jgi:hypothetical protein
MSTLAFTDDMARVQRALAQCHDMVVRRSAVLEALRLRRGERVLELGTELSNNPVELTALGWASNLGSKSWSISGQARAQRWPRRWLRRPRRMVIRCC